MDDYEWEVDANGGYVRWPKHNLVEDVRLSQFEEDLRRGDGSELRMKSRFTPRSKLSLYRS